MCVYARLYTTRIFFPLYLFKIFKYYLKMKEAGVLSDTFISYITRTHTHTPLHSYIHTVYVYIYTHNLIALLTLTFVFSVLLQITIEHKVRKTIYLI